MRTVAAARVDGRDGVCQSGLVNGPLAPLGERRLEADSPNTNVGDERKLIWDVALG